MTIFKQFLGLKMGLLLSRLLPLPVLAQNIEEITIFGDSLSDNGNAFKATNSAVPPNPPYLNGRFSNGPVWVEGFSTELKLPAAVINNFAFGGATSGTGNTVLPILPGLTTEINQFLVVSPRVNPNGLVVIWAGTNDYIGGGAVNPVPVVGNLTTAVQRLIGAGAQQFIVSNLPDLGKIPVGLATPIQSAGLSQLSAAHNLALRTSIQTLVRNNPNISIIPTDMAALFNATITNPARFGFTNVTQSCVNPVTGTVCATPDTFVFWDTLHPTAAGHRLISAYALDTLTAPRSIAAQAETGLGTANQQTRDINTRLLALRTSSPPVARQLSVFASGDSNFGNRSATSTNAGFNIDTKGLTVGADYPITDRIAVGVAVSSTNTNNQLNDNRGKVAVNSTSISVYGNYTQDKFYSDALLNYGWNDFTVARNIRVPGFTAATATPSGNQLSFRVSGGYDFGTNGLSFGPTAGIRYSKINVGGYTEQNGDILNLKVNPQDLDSLIFNLGAQISYPFKASFGTISPYFAANFEHEFGQNGRQVVTELVTQPGIPIRTKIGASDTDFIRLSTGFQTEFTNNLSVNLGYETIVGKDNFSDNYLNAKIRYQF
ncbi:MAG: autotransporter domain-containing protein [Chamaesiphon sp.]|nr:autotransporter domain-containing protein [Chamaesiphon sp.]